MWLRSSQQLAKLDITHVHVLSSCLRIQDTARDLDNQGRVKLLSAEVALPFYLTENWR